MTHLTLSFGVNSTSVIKSFPVIHSIAFLTDPVLGTWFNANEQPFITCLASYPQYFVFPLLPFEMFFYGFNPNSSSVSSFGSSISF